MSFQERQKTKNHSDQQGNHLKASVRYLVYSRMSGIQPGGVVVVTSSFSDSIVFAVHTRKTAFSNSTVFKSFHSGERFRNDPFSDRCSVDGSRIRNKTVSFSFENGVVWTGPKTVDWITECDEKSSLISCRRQKVNLFNIFCGPTSRHTFGRMHYMPLSPMRRLRERKNREKERENMVRGGS